MTRLVGLIGAAGSGKTTVARHLRANRSFLPLAFATPSRDMLNVLFRHLDIDPRWEDREWKETPLPGIGVSPRQLHQTLGTDWGRERVNPDLWIGIASRRLNLLGLEFGEKSGDDDRLDFVIEDVRFHNEAQWILERGGQLIHLIRPDAKPVAAHSSEQAEWTSFARHEVVNNGSLDSLFQLVDHILALEPAVPS